MKSISRMWLRARRSAAELLRDQQRHRGDRIRRDRADHAGDVLRHGGIFVRRGGRPQGHAGGANAVRPDLAIDVGRRHRHDQFLRRKRCDPDAVFRDADARPRSPNCMSIPTTLDGEVQWSKGYRRTARARYGTAVTIPIGACGRRDLSDLQRSQLSLHAGRRLCDGESRRYAERRRLYTAAPVDLRFLSDPPRPAPTH